MTLDQAIKAKHLQDARDAIMEIVRLYDGSKEGNKLLEISLPFLRQAHLIVHGKS